MTPRHSHIASLTILILLLASCGQKTAKTAESTPMPTATAPPAEQPVAPERPAEPAPPPQSIAASPSETQPRSGRPQSGDEFTEESALQDIFFGPGRADIERSNARFMKENARWINENPSYLVLIEGHTDARGTSEARLAIADQRAKAAARFLLEEGVSNTRLFTISHGSERPVCVETTDGCAARNRRVHFRVKKQ
jgi:peptidoglycan-associated lipoprotein